MENQLAKNMEHEMETGGYMGSYMGGPLYANPLLWCPSFVHTHLYL